MPLIKCPDCNKDISSRAQMCPFCGCPSEYFYDNSIATSESKEKTNKSGNGENSQCHEESNITHTAEKSNEQVSVERDNNTHHINAKENTPPTNIKDVDEGKVKFQIIQDPERESDKYKDGKTHVLFRLSNDKSISIAKTDLFYAPIRAESREVVRQGTDNFAKYISSSTSINELTKAACEMADMQLAITCRYFVDKLISYQIYNYDISNFVDRCGSGVFLENTRAYKDIRNQISDVSDYADELAYQRVVERASRSHWEGGGFGVKGAIKGAITAGAMNAATGAFRGIGDRMTDTNDRNEIKAMMSSIVNDKNKEALFYSFCSCLDRTEIEYFKILGENTGWDNSRLFAYKTGEIQAKLGNIENIKDPNARYGLLVNLLTENPMNDSVIEYALTHYYEYGLDIRDLNHFAKRLNPVALGNWKESNYKNTLGEICKNCIGEDRVNAIEDYGLAYEMIDDEYRIIDDACGPFLLRTLLDAQMAIDGFTIGNVEGCFRERGYSGCEKYLKSLADAGEKYNAIIVADSGNEVSLTDNTEGFDLFVNLKNDLIKQLRNVCIVRGIECNTLQEAKNLYEEWEIFDSIYTAYDTYADYDSDEMKNVIAEMESRSFKDKHILDLIYGNTGLKKCLDNLLIHETTEEYRKGKQIKQLMKGKSDGKLFVYGDQGFLEKAKEVRTLDKVVESEPEFFPLVIYDASDGNNFKGFIVSEKYFYNYNSMLGIGFGDKAISLSNIINTSSVGKNRIFVLSNGKTEKVKIIGAEDIIISVLSKVFEWEPASEKQQQKTFFTKPQKTTVNNEKKSLDDSITEKRIKKPCPSCGQFVDQNAKFCGFCGNKVVECEPADISDRIECPNCGQRIAANAKFCNYCGSSIC